MEIRQLLAFVTVARLRSFTRAADELSLTQPAVTRQVGSLETEIGVRLMDRLGRRVELTAPGIALMPYAEQILRASEEARRKMLDINHGSAGRLSIGSSSTAAVYLLPQALIGFRAAYPNVQLSVATGPSQRVAEMVRTGDVDIGIVMDYQEEHGIGAVVLSSYEVRLVVPPDHPLASVDAVQSAELAAALEHTTLLVMQPGSALRRCVEALLAAAGITMSASIELDSIEAIKKMIESGIGISILPDMAIGVETAAGRLNARSLGELTIDPQRTATIYRSDKYITTAMRGFLTILSQFPST